MSDNIDIKIREDGSRVVSRNLEEIAKQAEKANKSVQGLNSALTGSQKSGTSLQWLRDNIQQVDSFGSQMVQRFGANLTQYRSTLMKHFEMISQGAKATSSNIKDQMESMTTTPSGVKNIGDYYRAQEAAHNQLINSAVANMAKQTQLEQAEYSKRLSSASAAIAAKQKQDSEYTAWWAKELAKRDALESKRQVEISKNRLALATKDAGDKQRYWNLQAAEGHALARGLSGSLGTLWMTYGSLLPLLAGAALGSAFVQAAKKGSEFAYQLEFVRAIGNETKESIKQLEDQALSLGSKGAYGPVQIAEGYRGLAQAGLDASQQLRVMPDVLNMATAGELSMEAASLSLVGVLNAFNLGIEKSSHVSDVFVKAAAVSQTSVSQMTESMKYASVVGDQYKVSLEDTATALALLAKNNITGTSAGTAFRNMVKELYTPTREAASVMEKLQLKTSDASGKLRPFADVVYGLRQKISTYDQISQVNILQKLFGERGAKEAIAMLSLTKEGWEELRNSISNSDGFAKGIREALGATAQNEWKAALNSLEAQFIRTFKNLEPQFVSLAQKVKDLFNSPEFANGIQAIVSGIGTVLGAAIDLAPALVELAKAWVTLKLATLAYTAAQSVVTAFVAIQGAIRTTQMVMMTFAAVSAGTATTLAGGTGLVAALGLIANPLGIILGLLVAGATAWALWGKNSETASGKAIKTAQEKIKALENENKYGTGELGKERQELERLQEIYDLRNRTRGLDIAHVNEARKAVDEQQKLVDLLEQQEAKMKGLTTIKVPDLGSQRSGLPSGKEHFNFDDEKSKGASGKLSRDESALAALQAKLKARKEEYDIMVQTGIVQYRMTEGATTALRIQEQLNELNAKDMSGLKEKGLEQRRTQISLLERQLSVAKQLDEQEQQTAKFKFSKELEEEVRLAKMLPESRALENEFLQKRNQLASHGVLLTEQEQEALRGTIQSIQEINRIVSIKNSLLQESINKRREFNEQVQAIQQLKDDPNSGYTPADASAASQNLLSGMGLDTTGTDAEIQAKTALYQQYYQNLELMKQANLISERDYSNARIQIALKEQQLRTQNAAQFFSTLSSLQNSNVRELAAIGKAAAITQAIINTYEGATKAYAQGGYWGAAYAAAVVAAGMAQVAQIRSQGFLTGGSFTVGGSGGPDSQQVAFRATPGERVTVSTPTQVRKGDPNNGKEAGEQPQAIFNPKIVNVLDPAIVGDYLGTDDGEKLIMNIVRRNQTRN